MNVFLRKQLLLFILLASAASAWGQIQYRNLVTDQNQTVRDTFAALTSAQYTSTITRGAASGSVQLHQISSSKYELTYTPNTFFTGRDSFRVQIFTCTFCLQYLEYSVQVSPSSIIANHDYAYGAKNSTVSINVLNNDYSSNGVLQLKVIPLANDGTATFQPGAQTIEFTPAPDFEGNAYVNYVVCNGAGLCDNGTVTIQVLGNNPSTNDTLQVFTKKNNSQVILIPNTFSLVSSPSNGTYTTSGDAPEYVPNQNFTGKDYIHFSNGNGGNKVVEVIVLDAEDNAIAFDDEAYTSPNNPVEVNVLDNDLYKGNSGCFTVQSQPQSGTVQADASGLVTYTPAAGFQGVDWFTYSENAPGCGGKDETATVYVYVSNFEPSQTKFHMNTPKRTPLVIGNNVPISNFMYKIKSQGSLGQAVILEGSRDTVIYNQTITGNNLILYLPNDNVTSGTDDFEITYCVLDDVGNCSYQKSIKIEIDILDLNTTTNQPSCFNDCIWPGDTNLDGVVNMEDLLPIGLSMGSIGMPRSETIPSQWYGLYGNDWSGEEGDINLKHIDTNGDSLVTALDTTAIRAFYGNTHDLTSVKIPFYKYNIELQGDVFFNPGDLVELDMIMGNEAQPVVDLYGFTFPFEYNPLIFKPESVSIDYSKASWLTYNSPTLNMSHNDERGLVETGFTRTSGISASGFGQIGKVRFVVVEDINGFHLGQDGGGMTVQVGGGTSVATNGAGQTYGVTVQPFQIHIVPQSKEEIENTLLTDNLLKVYPNPAQSLLNVHLNGGQEFERALIYNITGQVIYDSGKTLARATQVDVSHLENGMYVLSVVSSKGVLNKKFEILR